MVTQVDKRRSNKFYDFHNDKGHSTDECIHLKKQIEELVRAGKLSHLIKEIKQGRDQSKVGKKEAPAKEKSMAIYMGERRFACYRSRGGHMIHRMYVDGGSSTEVLYENCFNRLRPKIKSQMVPATTSLTDFNGETIWPLGQLRLLEIAIGGTVSAKGQTKLCSLLKENMDIFPWQSSDMTGVPRSVAKHRLNIQKGYPPVRQKKRGQASKRARAIQVEMAESDEEKTAFHTSHGVYCYTKMPFGLKNADATYQRLVDKAFDNQSAISVVLIIERGTVQKLVYFVSGALQGPKLNYTLMEKLVLALVFATKRVITKIKRHAGRTQYHVPAKDIRERTDPSGLLYREAGRNSTRYISAGLILTSPEGTEFTYALKFQFTASNNEAEYEALIAGLQIATLMGVRNVHVSVDSKLVANQVLGTYVAKEKNMIKYLEKTKSLVSGFANFSISQVPRSKNKKADALSKIASTSFAHLSKQVLVQVLKEKYIQEKEVATVIEEGGPTWMTPIMNYLKDGTLPDDRKEASKLRIKARQYELLEGVLYSRMHARPRSVVAKAMRLGYYWPTMHRDAWDMILKWTKKGKKFDSCYGLFYEVDRGEIHGDNHRQSGEEVHVGQHSMSFWPSRRNSLEQRSCHGDTPFFLTYGTKAVIPMEIRMPTYHTTVVDTVHNDEELRLNLDLLKERREHAAIQKAKAKLKMRKYYNARFRSVTFRPGEFVYRSNEASHVVGGGKLGPKWEGSYEVMEVLGDGAYMLSVKNKDEFIWGIVEGYRKISEIDVSADIVSQFPVLHGGEFVRSGVKANGWIKREKTRVEPWKKRENVEGYRSEIDVSAEIVSQFPMLTGGEFARSGGQSEWLDQKGEDSSGTVEEVRKWYKLIGKMV
nr:reverse transcriptase domain-containing protein [Tanacetum cinerariifolium]